MTPDALPAQLSVSIRMSPSGCWEWTKQRSPKGYGHVKWQRRNWRAHRLTYELLVAPIPTGMTIDHLCRNAACVNPEHLEVVTNTENNRRSPLTIAGANIRKTHCPHGHAYDEANTRHYRGQRHCRTCARLRQRAKKARLAEMEAG
jgi:hypothetical protein